MQRRGKEQNKKPGKKQERSGKRNGYATTTGEPCDNGRAARGPLPADAAAFVSPAACARNTAAAPGLSATPADALADIAGEAPGQLAAWTREPDAAPPGGESFGQLVRRVGGWLDAQQAEASACNAVNKASFASAARGRTIVAITHAPLLRAAGVHAPGASPEVFCRIEIAPLSAVELRHSRRGWSWWAAVPL
jgi:hypothetical protein